jgi:hypothetical protein
MVFYRIDGGIEGNITLLLSTGNRQSRCPAMMDESVSSRGEMVRMPAGSRVERNSISGAPGAASPVPIFTRIVNPARKSIHGCTFFLFFMCVPLYWQCKDKGIAWYFAIHRTKFFLVVLSGG